LPHSPGAFSETEAQEACADCLDYLRQTLRPRKGQKDVLLYPTGSPKVVNATITPSRSRATRLSKG
jgi:hypothetical protein